MTIYENLFAFMHKLISSRKLHNFIWQEGGSSIHIQSLIDQLCRKVCNENVVVLIVVVVKHILIKFSTNWDFSHTHTHTDVHCSLNMDCILFALSGF